MKNNEFYTNCCFDVGFGEKDNFVITQGVYPVYNDVKNYHDIIKSTEPVKEFERMDLKLEDCIIPDKSYIEEIRN